MNLLTTAQVAELTGIPAATLRFWRFNSTGPASFRLGRRVVYRSEEVTRWLAEEEARTTKGGNGAA